jgi:tRNA(Ile)-lysidine synthase
MTSLAGEASSSHLSQTVRKTLREFVQPRDKVLVAVSGGPDSVALLHALKGSPFHCIVAHIDHQLRSGSSGDARFVQRLAAKWDFAVRCKQLAVLAEAKKLKQGIEETARQMRYSALLNFAKEEGCMAILTGHHREDQAETVLFNFLRGAGSLGLAAMPRSRRLVSGGPLLIRPLLTVSRAAIRAYLKENRVPYRIDPSNGLTRFSRNRIRHQTLPLLARDFPGLVERLAQQADLFSQEEDFWSLLLAKNLSKTARRNKQKLIIDLKQLFRYHKALGRRLLRALLPGLSFQEVERLFFLAQQSDETATLLLSGGLAVSKRADKLVISAISGPGRKRLRANT